MTERMKRMNYWGSVLTGLMLLSGGKVGGVSSLATSSAMKPTISADNNMIMRNCGSELYLHSRDNTNNERTRKPLAFRMKQLLRKRKSDNSPTAQFVSISITDEAGDTEGKTEEEIQQINHVQDVSNSHTERGGATSPATDDESKESPGFWPCGDKLDKQLIGIALPCIANFAINPLIGAVDLFWINRMGNPLAVAGQAAANQVFNSAFWLTSFLPSVTATLVAKQAALKSEEGIQDAICQALFVGFSVAMLGSAFILSSPSGVLNSVLGANAPAREFATPYLLIRGFAFLPSLISLIGFSAFRGVLDTTTPLKISLFANLFNAIFDPILIFKANMGVTGAALATLMAEVISAVMFTTLMFKRKMILPSKIFKFPSLSTLAPLLKGGAALQLRNFALNVTFLSVTRVTQAIDNTGIAASAHAMAIQTFQIGGIVLLALSTVAQTVVPNAMTKTIDDETGKEVGGLKTAKTAVNRLMSWGLVLGTVLGGLQVLLLPYMQRATPIEAVRKAARNPALLASLYQIINGMVFIGEGVMIGTGSFLQLSLSTVIATSATLLALNTWPQRFGLTGVWMSFGIFNSLRLIGVAIHQMKSGPLSAEKLRKEADEETKVA